MSVGVTPCDSCPAPCCRNFVVDVTTYDAYRIGSTLKMSMADFTDLVWSEEPDEKRRILFAEAKRFYRLILTKVLEREAADGEEAVHRCSFLLPVASRGICAVYGVRPEICRTYPTHYESGTLTTGGGTYCPDNAWSIEKMDVIRFQADWVFKRRMHALNDAVVDGWNERVIARPAAGWTKGDFYGYLTTLYRDLELRQPEVFRRPEPGAAPRFFAAEELAAGVDEVLRRIGWRTDETAAATNPGLGKQGRVLEVLPSALAMEK